MKTHYDTLGVSEFSEIEIIASAYRALMRKYHECSNIVDAGRVHEIKEAYAVLGDPIRRAEYDASLAGRQKGGQIALANGQVQNETSDFPNPNTAGDQQDLPIDPLYAFEDLAIKFVKNKMFIICLSVVYIMFWPVLSGPNLLCRECDHSYSVSQFFQELHYPLLPVSVIGIPSAIISVIAQYKMKIENIYFIFLSINIVASLWLINEIL